MKEPASCKRLALCSRLASWLGIAALLASVGCESTPLIGPAEPEAIDLSPLLELPVDLSDGLLRAFPDYEPLVIAGVQQSNRQVRRDGVVELIKETYDSELDEGSRWVVGVSLTLFDTPAKAAEELDSSCYTHAHGGASSPVRWREGVYCISSVLHLLHDPRSMHLPTNTYFSWVIVRRDQLVVRLYERHKGSRQSAKNQIIQEIAGRLSSSTASTQ